MRRRVPASSSQNRSSRFLETCLGVDLVEYKKAKTFYTEHRGRLPDYFDKSEVSLIRKARRPYESLAMLLAAKEAVFKSSDLPWMGPEGFRKIRIVRRKNAELSFRLKGDFKRGFPDGSVSSLFILKKKNYVVAGCRTSHLRNGL